MKKLCLALCIIVFTAASAKELNYLGPSLENPSFIALDPRWEELLNKVLQTDGNI